MRDKSWNIDATRMVYHQFGPGEAFVAGLEQFALDHGIREAAVTSCIGSFRQLNLRNLCRYDEGNPEFERSSLNENLELVSAEGYIQPLPDSESGIRAHIHIAAARPSGEMIGGHCEEATTFTGAFLYLHILDEADGQKSR